jgi:excinuclease ABC subunit C
MSGQTTAFTRRIEREMKAAAAELDFERAARLRDDLKALERALEKSAVVFGDGTDADVIAVADEQLESAVQVFHVRGGRIRGQRGFVVDKVEDLSPGELVGQLLVRLYGGETGDGVPREVLVPTLPPDAAAVGDWLATLRGSRVDLRVPQRGDKHDLMQTVQRNAVQSLALHKTKRASDLTARSRALEELQEALDLPEAPLRIECIDVSHLQGTDVVASLVVFEDGLPRKSEYRRFALRGAAGSDGASNDDVRSIAEVVTRRFTRLLEEKAPTADDPVPGIDPTTGRPRKFSYPPQLFVVDGGRPQVEAAAGAMSELGIVDVALVGLAKRLEEVWLPGEADPVVLPRTSEGLYLLQRLRDEAHRFAITYQRTKRATRLVDSLLDDVPGLGEARKKALLRTFGSLTRLRAATVAEIASVPGMGPVTAEAVVAALQAQQPALAINTSTGEIIEATTADPAGPVPIEGSMP